MILRPPRSQRTGHAFPTLRSSELLLRLENVPGALEQFTYEHGRTLRAVTERYRRLHRATKAPRTTNPRGKLKLSDARLLADRKSTRLNSSHQCASRMPSSA